jgi:hypothetical protein
MNRTVLSCVPCLALVVATSCSQGGQSPLTAESVSGGTSPANGGSQFGGASNSSSGGTATSNATTGGVQNTSTANTGGNGNGGNGNGGASTGTTSTGGTNDAGGKTGAGGTSESAGGSVNAGGKSTGAGGSGMGGASPKGGAATGGSGVGGASSKGGAAAGGAAAGGAATTGGAATGGAATGGAATGGVNAAGGSTSLDPKDIVPDLMGFYWEGTCMGNISATGKNCPFAKDASTSSCPSSGTWDQKGAIRDKTISVKGTTGTKYIINFEVRGVAGTRCYTGGTAASTATPSATGANNTWYVGGKQANDSIWNTYEIRVDPPVTGEANVYFANAFPSNPDWCQKEASYEIGYSNKFAVTGGGTIKFTIHDANCLAQQNCGPNDASSTCDAPRTVSLSGMTPAATFTQPPTNSSGGKTYYPQWLYFSVKSITLQ